MERKVCLYIAMSLDGYIAAPGDDLSFLSRVEREGEDYGYADFTATIDTVILGRRTYDWVKQQIGLAHYGDKKLYVLTRTARAPDGNATFYTGEAAALIESLRQEAGRHIFCDGGAQVANLLMAQDLVDEYTVSVIPVLLGEGIRLFDDHRPQQEIKLLSARQFDSGLVQLHYRRER